MLGKSAWENNNHISDDAADSETTEDVESVDRRIVAVTQFILIFGLDAFFFVYSVEWLANSHQRGSNPWRLISRPS